MITARKKQAVLLCASGLLVLQASSGASQTAPKAAVQGSLVLSWEEILARNPGGRRWQLVQAPTASLDELEMHVTEVAAGKASHAPHRHADEEIIIIKQGTFDVLADGKTYRGGPGTVIFHATQTLHGLTNVSDGPGVYHVIRWRSSPQSR
jgi:XRE family transcriptional regulator, regulator of sulfur utilization